MRGGARKNAGRPPGPKGTKGSITFRLTPDVLEFLETFGDGRSDHVDATLRKTAALKTWLKSQGGK